MNCKILLGYIAFIFAAFVALGFLRYITPDDVSFWAAVTGVATCGLAFVAWYQIGAIKKQQQGWETLRACSTYDTDSTINFAIEKITDTDSETGDYGKISTEATTLLNYFTTLAVGIRQGFYIEKIVRDHLEKIIRQYTDDLFTEDHSREIGITVSDYVPLRKLLAEWDANPSRHKSS